MLQKSVFNSSKTIDHKVLALLTTRSWDSHPGGFFAPLRSLGATARGRTYPASTLSLWLHRSIIITLHLSSPPSGCNPDSDSSPLSLSSEEGLRAVVVNLAWNFNSGTSNVPYGLVIFSCQGPMKIEKSLFTFTELRSRFVRGVFGGKLKM